MKNKHFFSVKRAYTPGIFDNIVYVCGFFVLLSHHFYIVKV